MAHIPGWLLRHRVTAEPYLGSGAHGDAYGPPVRLRAQVEETRRKVRDKTGAEVVSEATLRGRLSTAASYPPGSRVTLPTGRVARVISTRRHDDAGLGGWQHVEVILE
ncbi:hypothetical protein [Nocardiopsis sp. HUAS JQ3]|uniref:hypothetical protein n=1 Tax=Nocardiopsis sp. HUAS JQ3 TaxID=3061629 RepID=UPI0023A920A2|nr:hypothetical protein [Nocardiopsis sp. HUAS JQ3]WDZ91146.1 hypothetical protein PV789_00790 [Nocardiopsis sp. HUAS JQ3]